MDQDLYKNNWGWNSTSYDISTILEQFLEKEEDNFVNKKKRTTMKKCEVCMPDGNGKVSIGQGCVFISPTTTGFMLYTNPDGEVEIHCFSDFNMLVEYLQDNKLMDLTQTRVAENI